VVVGESLCSQTSAWLKVGTTALVVAMIEGDLLGDDALAPRHPLAAMGRFARDVACRARVKGCEHRFWTAIQLQRHYLERAEAHLDHPVMPPWAPQVCRRWRAILDRLAEGPQASTILSRVLELKGRRPALARCRLLCRVLDNWDLWVGGDCPPDSGGDFFWGV
jgi:hypothetical protein